MMMMLSSRLLARGRQGGDRDDLTNLWGAFFSGIREADRKSGYVGVDRAH